MMGGLSSHTVARARAHTRTLASCSSARGQVRRGFGLAETGRYIPFCNQLSLMMNMHVGGM